MGLQVGVVFKEHGNVHTHRIRETDPFCHHPQCTGPVLINNANKHHRHSQVLHVSPASSLQTKSPHLCFERGHASQRIPDAAGLAEVFTQLLHSVASASNVYCICTTEVSKNDPDTTIVLADKGMKSSDSEVAMAGS